MLHNTNKLQHDILITSSPSNIQYHYNKMGLSQHKFTDTIYKYR